MTDAEIKNMFASFPIGQKPKWIMFTSPKAYARFLKSRPKAKAKHKLFEWSKI